MRPGSVSKAFLPALLLGLLAGSLPACQSAPGTGGSSRAKAEVSTEDLKALNSRDARMRKRARERILTLGAPVCRALGREVTSRAESLEIGPGFICLLRILGALGGPEAGAPLCRAACKRPLGPAVRVEAVRALGMLRLPGVEEALLECAGAREPVTVRIAALRARQVRSGLLKHLAFGTAPVRESAARSLLSCREREVRAQFRCRLLDVSPSVRLLAVGYQIRNPDPTALILLRSLAIRDTDLRVAAA
ncbi:MAG: HEAT repeat domain-containing protein, partial [Planctomycetota bacterium]